MESEFSSLCDLALSRGVKHSELVDAIAGQLAVRSFFLGLQRILYYLGFFLSYKHHNKRGFQDGSGTIPSGFGCP